MNPPTPTELDAAVKLLNDFVNTIDAKEQFQDVEALRLVLTALRDARKDVERLAQLWSDTTVELLETRSLIKEYVAASITNMPASRVQKSWEALKAFCERDSKPFPLNCSTMSARSDEKGRQA